jgi:hypothetical protein
MDAGGGIGYALAYYGKDISTSAGVANVIIILGYSNLRRDYLFGNHHSN